MRQRIKKPFEFHSLSEIFYCDMTRLRTRVLVLLCNVNTQEPFQETKIWNHGTVIR